MINFEPPDFPSRDQSFGERIHALSQPETGPHADNFLTNEESYLRVANDLAERFPEGTVYLGVGPDQNFSYIAHARPAWAFILDYRRRNTRLHLLHKALFALCRDRVEYLSWLLARHPRSLSPSPTASELVEGFTDRPLNSGLLDQARREVERYLRPLGILSDREWEDLWSIQARLAGPGLNARFLALPIYPSFGQLIQSKSRRGNPAHLLAEDTLFDRVRRLQIQDRITPIVADFSREASLIALSDWLRSRRLCVGALYISDVEFFLLKAGQRSWRNYIGNLEALPWAEGAVLIRTSTREIEHPERIPPDHSTTILRSVSQFLKLEHASKLQSIDDLFAPAAET